MKRMLVMPGFHAPTLTKTISHADFDWTEFVFQ